MRRKLLSGLLIMCVVLSLLPVGAFAAGDAITMEGTEYAGLAEALAAVPDNAERTIMVPAGSYTFDGFEITNGKKITLIGAGELETGISTSSACAFQLAGDDTALTLKNMTLTSTSTAARVVRLTNHDDLALTVENVTFVSSASSGTRIGIYANGDTMESGGGSEGLSISLNNWTYKNASNHSGLYLGNFQDIDLSMEDCDVLVKNYGIYFQTNTVATVSLIGSTLNGWAAFYSFSCDSDVTIDDCALIGTNVNGGGKNYFGTIVFDGGGLSNPPGTEGRGNTVRVYDSTIEAHTTAGNLQAIASCNYGASDNSIGFSDCTFVTSGTVSLFVTTPYTLFPLYSNNGADNSYTVDGLSMGNSNFGEFGLILVAKIGSTGYTTLGDALAAAASGQTVALLSDIELDSEAAVDGGAVTLDLQAHAVTTKGHAITVKNGGALTITGNGTLHSDIAAGEHPLVVVESGCALSVENGMYATSGIQLFDVQGSAVLHAGFFTAHPGDYAVAGKKVIFSEHTVAGKTYAYQIAEAISAGVELAVSAGTTSADLDAALNSLDADIVTALETAAGSAHITHGLTEAATGVLSDSSVINSALAASAAAALSASDTDTITIVVVPYLDITIKDYDQAANTLTLDMEALYKLMATTDDPAAPDAVLVDIPSSTKKLSTPEPVTVELAVPAALNLSLPSELFVKHIKTDGKTYVYEASYVALTGVISFVNPNGFSEFIIGAEPVASITASGVARYFATLQDALDHVENGQTITLLADGLSAKASKAVTFTVVSKSGESFTADITARSGYTVSLSGNTYTVTRVSSADSDSAAEDKIAVLPFTDVRSGDWFYDAVAYVYGKHVMVGITASTFEPNADLTRGMMAQILFNLEGKPTSAAGAFSDVAESAWYADAVNWAAENKLVFGYGDNTFGPEDSITREQLAAILYRYAQMKGRDVTAKGELDAFDDGGEVSVWAKAAMEWAVGAKLMTGKDSTTLAPTGTATRAEVAQVLRNMLTENTK